MTTERALWPAIIAGSALLTALAMAAGVDSWVRTVIALWFLLVCPGMAWARFLPVDTPSGRLTVAVAMSITIDLLVSVALLYANVWEPGIILAVVIAITLCGAAAQLARPPRPRTAQ